MAGRDGGHRPVTGSVTGMVKVVPDEVTFTGGLTIRDPDLIQLRRLGERRSRAVFEALRAQGEADKDMAWGASWTWTEGSPGRSGPSATLDAALEGRASGVVCSHSARDTKEGPAI